MKHPSRTLIKRKRQTGAFKGILDKSRKKGQSDKERHDICIPYMPLLLHLQYHVHAPSELAQSLQNTGVEDAEIWQYTHLIRGPMAARVHSENWTSGHLIYALYI